MPGMKTQCEVHVCSEVCVYLCKEICVAVCVFEGLKG